MNLYQKVILVSAGFIGACVVAWKTMFHGIEHDLKLLNTFRRLVKVRDKLLSSLIIDKFEKHVAKHPKKAFVIYEDNVFSYEFVDQMACKVANIAKSWGLGPRDCVAMMMQNEPAFVWTFLGLQKHGITVALINYNLRHQPLIHCVMAAEPKYFIVGSDDALLEPVIEILDDLGDIKVFAYGLGSNQPPDGIRSLDALFIHALSATISPTVRKEVTLEDNCCYIYTSGTTGVPKPAFITHRKSCICSVAAHMVSITPEDIMYLVLPLYHTAGCATGMFGVIAEGATMVLRKKFSASHFWEDCRRHDVTLFHYIGELFRYLVAQPPNKLDAVHKVRGAYGGGLRKDIWEEVNRRFKIPLIAEFFGSTEGLTITMNIFNKPGAIGRLSPIIRMVDPDPKALVKFDYGTAMPIRDKNGRCIKVQLGEPGLFIAKIPDILLRNGDFQIYRSSKESNEKKMIRDAFNEGDVYLNYGDVLVQDKEYFLYFKDRIGDTFRWKGENVSTVEVANVIASVDFLHDANVYGISIPDHDGRAGMVSITLNDGQGLGQKELKELYDHICKELPSYARPLFIRHLSEAVVTGTFKNRKIELVNDGFDHDKIPDPLYYLDTERTTYTLFTRNDVTRLLQSRL